MEIFLIFIIGTLLIIRGIQWQIKINKNKIDMQNNYRQSRTKNLQDNSFEPIFYYDMMNSGGVAGNENGDLMAWQGDKFEGIFIKREDIVSVDIDVNGETRATTKKRGGYTRAALGGLAFSGAGAVVGAVNASELTKSREVIKSVSVQITTLSPQVDVITVRFLNSSNMHTPATDAIAEARKLAGIVERAIKASDENRYAEKEISAETDSPDRTKIVDTQPAPESIASQLTKLASLRKQGILTEAEFEKEKNKILKS